MMYEKQHVQMKMDLRNNRSSSFSNMKKEKKNSTEEERFETVDLSGLSLETLPSPTLNLGIVSKLDLSNNNLQIIPESLIARLLNVAVLDVHSNQLRSLPNSIGCLSKLKVLNVSGNLIESFPKTIENCRSLEDLNANFNQLRKLPDTIGFELINLKKLSVNSNKLVFLPHSLSHLTNLRILDVRLNCIRSLPEDLENLINLETLNVSQNFQYLETLPYSVGLLLSLVELDVSYNKITSLPDSIGCLRKLQKLCVEGNPLVSPPMEVIEQGLHAVKEYMSDRMNNGGTSQSHGSKSKKSSWVGRLVRYGTFNGRSHHKTSSSSSNTRHRHSHDGEGFLMPEYRTIDGLASPRYMGMFSPLRLFSSPRHSLSR